MKARAAVLESFNEPLVIREFDVSALGEKEILVKLKAAGVCGSDVHMWKGKDPRTPLPIILGHEGVGEVADIGGEKRDFFGRELNLGDLVIWDRGLTCGECYFCLIEKQPSLCPARKTYGISLSCKEPPYLRGCYAEYLHLFPSTNVLKLEKDVEPKVMVAASCSGATAAHAVELCDIKKGDVVIVLGPGPLGLFALAFALDSGAAEVHVFGREMDKERLELCKEFGASGTLNVDASTLEERLAYVRDITNGLGANVVIDCTGVPSVAEEGIKMVAPLGIYALPGIATPVGEAPISLYEDVSRKNVRIQGVWVSDISHLYQAVKLVEAKRYPFEKLVTHTFSLQEATAALQTVDRLTAIKAVLIP